MKITAKIVTDECKFESKKQFEDFVSKFPEWKEQWSFNAVLDIEDPKCQEILSYLEKIGHKPRIGNTDFIKAKRLYWIVYVRKYEKADYETARYLVPTPTIDAELADRNLEMHDGQLHIKAIDLRSRWSFAEACWWWVIVRKSVREALLASGLRGLEFQPVKVHSRKSELACDEFWELSSSVTLPPLSPTCTLFHNDGAPFTGDYGRGCRLDEGFYVPAEFHYRQSDLAGLPDFDIAHTHEQFPIVRPNDPRNYHKLVCSQRFYQFCCERKYDLNWVPVRIDPE